jgi:DNA-damage-inducible protein D
MAEVEGVERVALREEISDNERSLAGAAHAAGVRDYALFQNAGYRGLYNMDLRGIKVRKGVDGGRSLLDFMGKTELAANMFRITQTEDKIKQDHVRGQYALESTAKSVGQTVRKAILKIGGTPPEQLPAAEDVKEVRKRLKQTRKQLDKLDGRGGRDRRKLPRPDAEDRRQPDGGGE